ncbi:uncharacterized protein LOC142537723 [Primulina tabacum]|uniref:uncharacterized protein LOC142537723 n=1 Tax=Primulina tabacum TaxID=48773 RepID=UPI003F5AA573
MSEDDRVRRVTYMLRDDASLWWEGATHGVDLATLIWGEFKDIFYDKYFPADVRGRLTMEFMSIRQGNLSVAKFIRSFDRDCHLAPLIARDTLEKFRHFMDGLRPTIRRDIMLMRPETYDVSTASTRNHTRGYGFGIQSFDCVQRPDVYLADSEEIGASVKEKSVQADLVVLPLPEFDIILGMDWLSLNGNAIDFRRRLVSVRPPSGKPFIFEASRHQHMPHVISCICVRKLVRRGCQEFFASIVTVTEPDSQMPEDVEVVRDFPSVFSDDISGIPPDREVDYSIKLMPGTVPISKKPYRLAPA